MSQSSSRSCSNCGNSLPENMRFCSNCGAPADAGVGTPANYTPGRGSFSPAPPPPPNADAATQQAAPFPAYQRQAQQGNQPASPGQQAYPLPLQNAQPLPAYAKPQKGSSRGVLRLGIIILLILLVLGTAGYFALKYAGSAARSGGSSTSSGNGSNATGNGKSTPATSSAVKTTPINTTVTYASEVITIVDVKQARSFSDDVSTDDTLRLDIKEHTDDSAPYFGTYGYGSNVHLLLPNGDPVQVATAQESTIPPASTSRTNWIDFRVPVTVPVNQLTLRLGGSTEHQIDVPLTGQADVSKDQARTINPKTLIKYGGLNWTLTVATWQLSAQGLQADKGMSYIVLAFKVDNPTANGVYLSQTVGDAFRLQTGDATTASKYNTFPQQIQASETGVAGTVGFLVPQDSTGFTLVMLPYDRGGVTSTVQVSTPFQIP